MTKAVDHQQGATTSGKTILLICFSHCLTLHPPAAPPMIWLGLILFHHIRLHPQALLRVLLSEALLPALLLDLLVLQPHPTSVHLPLQLHFRLATSLNMLGRHQGRVGSVVMVALL